MMNSPAAARNDSSGAFQSASSSLTIRSAPAPSDGYNGDLRAISVTDADAAGCERGSGIQIEKDFAGMAPFCFGGSCDDA
jgi:hypothetical protein